MHQIISHGQVYSISHLATMTHNIPILLRGGFTKTVAVDFRFTGHCYTAGVEPGSVVPEGCYCYDDGSPHNPRPRVFDLERYTLSLDLPGLINDLIATNGLVSKTAKRDNVVRVDKVQVSRYGISMQVAYYIFMHPKKVQHPNRPKQLEVMVESAYPEKEGLHGPTKMRGSRPFCEMLGEYWG